jgi:hypothetical protein
VAKELNDFEKDLLGTINLADRTGYDDIAAELEKRLLEHGW